MLVKTEEFTMSICKTQVRTVHSQPKFKYATQFSEQTSQDKLEGACRQMVMTLALAILCFTVYA